MDIEKKVIQDCVKGNTFAQHKLYKVCYPMMMPVCMRYCKSKEDATELLNVGFYKILTALFKFDINRDFMTWAKRVLINSILDELRKNKRYKEHVQIIEESELQWQIETKQEWYDHSAVSAEDIFLFIQELSPLTASIFNLKAIDGYQHAEISQKLNIGLSASKWHYANAKKLLQEKILRKMKKLKTFEL